MRAATAARRTRALALRTSAAALAVLAGSACASSAAPSPTPTSAPAVAPTLAPADPAPQQEPESVAGNGLPDIASVVERAMPAVAQVISTLEEQTVMGIATPNVSQGSGFFFREDGYLLTNEHVIADAESIEAVLSNRQRLPAEVVGVDVATDLAVLKVNPDDIEEDVAVARLGSADAMRIGEWVIAIGSPLGLEGSVSVGVISAKGRSLGAGADRLNDLVQTDAVINPGNSGGPLLNLDGEVVGINTRVIRQTGFVPVDGIGFAISSDTARPVSDHLIEFGRVMRPRIGVTVQDVTPTVATERGLTVDEGALVISVAPGGPAERAGIEEDDVIVRLDGMQVTSTSRLVRTLLTDYRVGDAVQLGVVRAAVHLTFDLTLEEVPVNGDAEEENDDDER